MRIFNRIQTRLLGVATLMFGTALIGLIIYNQYEEQRLQVVMQDKLADKRYLVEHVQQLLGEQLRSLTYDYSFWDDMVHFANEQDSLWAEENLTPSLKTFNGDAIWVLDPTGKLIYSTAPNHADVANDSSLVALLSRTAQLPWFEHYFHMHGTDPIEIFSAPIQPSADLQRKASPSGYLVAGRVWDSNYISELSHLASSELAVLPPDHSSLAPATGEVVDREGVLQFCVPLISSNDHSAAHLQVRSSTALYEQLVSANANQLALFAFGGIAVAALFFLLLFLWVSRPLRLVSASLRMNQLAPIQHFLKSRTEFGEIARLVEHSFEQRKSLSAQEQSLRASEEKFRSIFEYSAEAAFLMDDVFIDCNEKACQLLDCTRSDIIGKSPIEFSPEYQSDGRTSNMAGRVRIDAARSGIPQHFRWQHRTKKGVIVEAEVSLNAIAVSGQELLHATVRDVTERVRAEQERMRLVAAIEQTSEAIVVTDNQARIEFVNPAFEAMTGYRIDEVIGKSTQLLKSGAQDSAFYETMWSYLLSGRTWRGQLVNKRKDGTTYREEMTISPIWGNDGQISNFVAFKRDISRQVELEQMLAQSQKMEALGRLAGGVAHDFNNLLTIILGHSEFLEMLVNESPDSQDHLHQIVRAADRAASLTRQLLEFSRKQVVQMRHVDINELITAMSKMFRLVLGESIEFKLTTQQEHIWVHADPSQIEQIVMNLVVNAKDAMSNGGQLKMHISTAEFAEDTTLAHACIPAGNYALVTVADTGCGMSEDLIAHIFEPFFTTKAVGKGTGLGLATAHGIVQNHHGVIDVSSKANQGTEFCVYLPLVTADEIAPREPVRQADYHGNSEQIMLVEDDDTLRGLVVRILKSLNYEVDAFDSAESALAAFSESPARYSLLLTDLIMPHIDGRMLAERIRSKNDSIAVLIMSGYANSLISDEVLERLQAGYITKPFTKADIGSKITSLLYERDKQRRAQQKPVHS